MTSEKLEEICIRKYGRLAGKDLYIAMVKISAKDFCVATGWDKDEVSIATSCNNRGRIFQLTRDYVGIILPDGRKKKITNLSYDEIKQYLPQSPSDSQQKHCDPDNPV